MIEENWLSGVMFTTVMMEADLNRVSTQGAYGDFQTGALSKVINTAQINDLVVKTWMTKAKERASTLVFCVDLNHVSNLTAEFRKHGIKAEFVTGDTPVKVRSARVDAFRNGEFPVLLNCGVFTEGTDIPNIDCVLLARPTKSRNLLVQMIGRGMRLHKGKENCHIIDMVAALSTGVVSTPTLFGLDPSEIVENADEKDMKELKERKDAEQQRERDVATTQRTSTSTRLLGTLSVTDYDSIHDLIADGSGDKYIREMSRYAWVTIDENKFVLSTNTGNYLVIEPFESSSGTYRVKYYWKLPSDRKAKSPYGKPRIIAEGETLEHAVHAADTFAGETFEDMWISKTQSWRRSPASQAQIDMLNKLRPADDQLNRHDVTKGKAGDMITRIKHGARGRFEKVSAKQRASQRIRDKQETLHQRGAVQVGPLA
jgi:ATP-dependent helicase IRC3